MAAALEEFLISIVLPNRQMPGMVFYREKVSGALVIAAGSRSAM